MFFGLFLLFGLAFAFAMPTFLDGEDQADGQSSARDVEDRWPESPTPPEEVADETVVISNDHAEVTTGAGNDTVQVNHGTDPDSEPPTERTTIDTGAGDDAIQVNVRFEDLSDRVDGPSITTGSGEDLVELRFDTVDTENPDSEGLQAAQIEDFEVGVDRLLIDTSEGSENYDLGYVQLSESTESEGPTTTVGLHFFPNVTADEDLEPQSTFITLKNVSGLTHDDLEIPGYTHDPLTTDEDDYVLPILANQKIFGGDGDDYFTGETFVDIDGEGGNDTFDELIGYNVTVNGGAGEDTFNMSNTGSQPTNANGGDDNDTFNIAAEQAPVPSSANGDAGDDTFNIIVPSSILFQVLDPFHVEGGEGADTFNLTGQGKLGMGEEDDPTPARSGDLVIHDFDPVEDSLTLDLVTELNGFQVDDVSLVEDGDDTRIEIGYVPGPDDLGSRLPYTSIIALRDVTGLTLADLNITGWTP